MPIENERKYILSLTPGDISSLVEDYAGIEQHITQAYVGDARIRSIFTPSTLETKYMFTWKKRHNDTNIEIETEISADDYGVLINEAKITISKTRVKLAGFGLEWDIDFLFDPWIFINDEGGEAGHYLTMAEVEMPVGMTKPKVFPDCIKNNMVYDVPLAHHEKWTNLNLSNVGKVKLMLKDQAGWEYV